MTKDGYCILKLYIALQLRLTSITDELKRSKREFVDTTGVVIQRSEKLLSDADVLDGFHTSYLQSPHIFGRL